MSIKFKLAYQSLRGHPPPNRITCHQCKRILLGQGEGWCYSARTGLIQDKTGNPLVPEMIISEVATYGIFNEELVYFSLNFAKYRNWLFAFCLPFSIFCFNKIVPCFE